MKNSLDATIDFVALFTAGVFLLIVTAAVFAADGFWAGTGWLLFQVAVIGIPVIIRRHRRQQELHAALVARADFEHGAIYRGDMESGVYGYYPPADV